MSDIDFGLDKIGAVFTQQADLQKNRQIQEQADQARVNAANVEKAKIANASSDINLNLLTDFQGLAATAEKNKKAADLQTERFSSGDPMSFLEGLGDQILNPTLYTARGRAKTMAEEGQYVNAKASLASAQQQALAGLSANVDAAVTAAAGPLESAKLSEKQGMEQINTERLRLSTMAENMATQQQMQSMALASLDSTQVKALSEKSNGQPIDVGGVSIQPGMLQARKDMLDQREDLIQDRENARTLRQMDVAAKRNRKVLETFSLEELRPMLQSGDPTGTYDLKDIQDVYQVKTQAQSDQIARATTQMQYADYSAQVTVPAADQADKMLPNVPKGTPLEAATLGLKSTAAMVANLTAPYTAAGKPIPVEIMTVANQAIQGSNDRVNKAIEQQAKLAGKGDKDLTELLTEKYRGNPLPAATVESAVQSRLDKNQPLTDIFPPEVAQKIQTSYAAKVQAARSAGGMGIGGPVDKQTLQAQAQREAVQEVVGQQIESRTNSLIANQVTYPGHPLAGIVDKTGLLQLTSAADSEARQIFMQRNQLTSEEMNLFVSGKPVPGKELSRSELSQVENTQLMFKLDAIKPGMAKQYADWWGNHGKFYLNLVEDNRLKAAQGDTLQNQALESFAAPIERQGGEMYMGSVQASGQFYDDSAQERYNNLVSFDLDPIKRQATMVQFDDSLTDEDRRTFMEKVVIPTTDALSAEGGDYKAINEAIEQQIQGGNFEDPITQKVVGKIVKNRDKVSRNLDAIYTKPWWGPISLNTLSFGAPQADRFEMASGRAGLGPVGNSTRINRDYNWLYDLMKNRKPSTLKKTGGGGGF